MHGQVVSLDVTAPIWERFYTVAPLVLVGTREEDGSYDLAPKHMATPMGWQNYFGFICTPRHRTYHNVRRERAFTVSYPRPTQVVLASLAASPRINDAKPVLGALPTFPARLIDGVFIEDGYLFLECELDRIIDDFGENSLVTGKIIAAHLQESAMRLSDRADEELLFESPLLVYLAPGRYAEVREGPAFPYPIGFSR